jgi:hypothetical protein
MLEYILGVRYRSVQMPINGRCIFGDSTIESPSIKFASHYFNTLFRFSAVEPINHVTRRVLARLRHWTLRFSNLAYLSYINHIKIRCRAFAFATSEFILGPVSSPGNFTDRHLVIALDVSAILSDAGSCTDTATPRHSWREAPWVSFYLCI